MGVPADPGNSIAIQGAAGVGWHWRILLLHFGFRWGRWVSRPYEGGLRHELLGQLRQFVIQIHVPLIPITKIVSNLAGTGNQCQMSKTMLDYRPHRRAPVGVQRPARNPARGVNAMMVRWTGISRVRPSRWCSGNYGHSK